MSQQQGTATDRLADIIHVVLIARQTGILQVQRGGGNTREEGSIAFANGQVIEAMGGGRVGEEALNWLKTWGSCWFVFTHKKLEEIVPPAPPTKKPAPGNKKKPEISPKAPSPFVSRDIPAAPIQDANNRNNGHSPPATQNNPMPSRPQGPYRLRQGSDALVLIERMGLSRMHRHIFLLIDGQRAAKELAWLTRLSLDEVYLLLNDLERAGLIRQ